MDALYRQVANEIDKRISTGMYLPGERLPGVRALARIRGISVSTAVAAYDELSARGRIQSRSRSGFYVSAQNPIKPIQPAERTNAEPPRPVTSQAIAMTLLKAANDPAVVQLGAAVPDAAYLPTQAIARALTNVMRTQRVRTTGYMMPPGAPELRRQIARRMSETGTPVSADEIVVTTGCQEALVLALRAVTSPGDVVAVESPAFYGLLHVLESLGLEALEIPCHPSDGMSLDALAFACERWSVKACVLTPTCSNPLGYCMSDDAKRALMRLLSRHKVPLIEDDVYGDLAFSSPRPTTCRSLSPKADVLYCSSFSKTLAPGLRVGWIVATGARKEHIEHLKYVSSIASPTVPQLAVAEILAHGRYERHLREARSRYASAVTRMSDAVMRTFPPGTRISQPQGGFVLWIELPEGTDSLSLARRALRQNISIAPGPLFSSSGKFQNFIRISSARVWDGRLERAMATLGRLAGNR